MLNTKNMQIYGEIYEYLSSKEKRPFLITGEWGSGKTYTINNFFEKFYKYNKQKIYKISCFGIDSRTTLISEMKNIFEKEEKDIRFINMKLNLIYNLVSECENELNLYEDSKLKM